MRKWLISTLALAMGCTLGGCPNGPVVESEGVFLAPRTWTQSGCDGESSSFNAVHTTFAVAALKKWEAPVGELAGSGPVIGPDGTIYVGNVGGALVAIAPDGTERWRLQLTQESITSTPAVDAETGDIYFAGQLPIENQLISRLHRVSSSGQLRSPASENMTILGDVKIWRDFVFVQNDRELIVLDKNTMATVSRRPFNCINLICGGPIFPTLIAEYLVCFGTLLTSELAGLTDCFVGYDPRAIASLQVSIVDNPNLVGDAQRPVVIIASDQCVGAFRFHPAGDGPPPFDPHFEPLWTRLLVEEECDADTVRVSAPAVIVGGQVVLGVDHDVFSLDLMSGEENWRRNVGDNLAHSPAGALRQIYLVTFDGRLIVLDSDGDFLSESRLQGSGRGAALSLDFVYVATDQGLHSFTLDPQEGFVFDGSTNSSTHAGAVIPALGEDGTVYVATPDGFVHAYASSGVLQKPARVPQVDWELSEGTQLTAAESIELSAVVSGLDGGAFSGTVEFASDIDGVLCQALAVNGRAACAPARPLSRGTHQLSAFALDESGGANLAPLTIEVLNREPTVEILTPELGSIIDETIEFTFVARVADAEETISDERVRWSSDLVGELGFGATMTRSMPVGVHTVTVVVTDSSGATAQDSVVLEVTGADSSEVGLGTAGGTSQGENAAPTVEIMTPELGSIIDESIEFTFVARVADAEDVEIADQQVRWSSDLVGELGVGATMTRTMPVGVHTVTVVVTDSSGATAQDSVVLEVIGAIP